MIQAQIQAALAEIEASEGAKILYACESGSCAWGFASTDSYLTFPRNSGCVGRTVNLATR